MGRYLALVLMALALAACGGGGGGALSLDPVASAADKTVKQGSERFTLHVEGGLPSGRYLGFTVRGVANNADGSGRFSVVFTEGGKSFHVDAVADGSIIYMRSDLFASKLPGGKSWIKVDVKKLADKAGLGSLTGLQESSPARPLQALRAAGKTTKVGKATIAGVPTTKYHTIVDLEKEKLADQMGAKHLPIDVWIDRKGLVRKMSFAQSPADPTKAGKFTYVLRGFGPAVTVKPPPSDEAIDIFDL
jgi:hypothetical protein